MKDKIGIVVGIGITVTVLVTLTLYIISAGSIELNDIMQIGIVLILVILATYILWDKMKNIKKGLPAEDERLKLINYKAGHYGFIAAMFSSVGSNVISEIIFDYELTASQLAGVVVMFSGLVFVATYLYLARKGI
jgi:Predicted membrane protein (DUF2178)